MVFMFITPPIAETANVATFVVAEARSCRLTFEEFGADCGTFVFIIVAGASTGGVFISFTLETFLCRRF
jgi:hypothetical protein